MRKRNWSKDNGGQRRATASEKKLHHRWRADRQRQLPKIKEGRLLDEKVDRGVDPGQLARWKRHERYEGSEAQSATMTAGTDQKAYTGAVEGNQYTYGFGKGNRI